MGPKAAQEGSKIARKSVFQGFPTSKLKKGEGRPISTADLDGFWGPLGAILGHLTAILGPSARHARLLGLSPRPGGMRAAIE